MEASPPRCDSRTPVFGRPCSRLVTDRGAARTIVMTIIRGEGVGSVVETHATPIEPGRSAVIEATLAASDRPQFHTFFRAFGGLMRPMVEKRARRLWVEDGAYAERRYELRRNGM